MHATWLRRAALAVTALMLIGGTVVAGATPGSAANTCTLTPQLRDVTINQGLGSYALLTRAKSAIVRAYMSLPSCAGSGAAIQVTGGSIAVAGLQTPPPSVTPTPAPASPYAQLATYSTAPALDAPADLKFVVPGSALDSTTAGQLPVTFTVTVQYGQRASKTAAWTNGTATFTTLSGSVNPIRATVNAASNNLRLLIVPVGDGNDTSGNQFPAAASTAVQVGMIGVGRVMPVRDGVGDIASTGTGLRYTIAPTMIDARALNLLLNGAVCIKGSNWPTLKGQLSAFMQNWNSANPTTPVDRVVGVAWNSTGSSSGCVEGVSTINGSELYARDIADGATPSPTGAVMAHELLHTMGGEVPSPNGPGDSGYHSLNTVADGTAPNRAYNLTTDAFMSTNRTVMNLTDSWDNTTTLFEPADYALAQCTLTPTSTGCAAPGSVGTAGATGNFAVAGTTDQLSAAGTNLHSYEASFTKRTGSDPTSAIKLKQYDAAGTLLRTDGLALGNGDGDAPTSNVKSVDAAIQEDVNADRFDVVNGSGTVLYSRSHDDSFSVGNTTNVLTLGNVANFTNAAGNDTQAALSHDGRVVAWVNNGQIKLQRTDHSGSVLTFSGRAPVFSHDDSHVIYVDGSNIQTQTVNLSGASPQAVGSPATIYTPFLGGMTPNGAAYTGDESSVVASMSDGHIWRIDMGGLFQPSSPINCNLLPVQCARITNTSGATDDHPSVSDTGDLVAFQRTTGSTTNVLTMDTSGNVTANPKIANASAPSWGGSTLVAKAASGGIVAFDNGGLQTLTTTSSDNGPALNADQTVIAFDRAANGQDVFVGASNRQVRQTTTTGANPAQHRLDIYVDCGDGHVYPIRTALSPTSTSSNTATFTYYVDPTTICPNGSVVTYFTNGVDRLPGGTTATAGADHAPAPAIASPLSGGHFLQFDSLAFRGSYQDADGPNGVTLHWFLTTPGSSTPAEVGHGAANFDMQPPLAVGNYTVTLQALDSDGQHNEVTTTFSVEADADHDGIGASRDTTCGGVTADNDPTNADADYDGDGMANRDDMVMCSSANNATVDFDPNSLNTGSSGTPVTTYITTSAGDLRTVPQSKVFITRIGTFNLSEPIPALSWTATSASHGTAQFARGPVNDFLRSHGLSGCYVPFRIEGSGTGFTWAGSDPTAPNVSS